MLKWLRVIVATVMFAGLSAAFVDFRSTVPSWVGHRLAGIQFVPSLVALLTGASLSIACVMVALITLTVGRIYCSAVCPLGVLQDVIDRLVKGLKRKSRPAPCSRVRAWVRQIFLWGTVIAAVAGWGGFALALLDPYSNFGRIASGVFRPLLTLANNAFVSLAEAFGWHGLFRVVPLWTGLGALALPVLVLVLVVALSARHGRLYCNTVCPVGTLLGWLSQRAAFRLQVDQDACHKCAACLRACKAHCIDLRTGVIDFSRCVSCYNCMAVCDSHGIAYHFAWASRPWVSSFVAPGAQGGVEDRQRRTFISKTALGVIGVAGVCRALIAQDEEPGSKARPDRNHIAAIYPPGVLSADRFLDRCIACHLCISKCPTGVLQPAFLESGLLGFLKPRMDYRVNFCNFDCHRCGEACPVGAIGLLDLAAKHLTRIGEAHFYKEKCVVVTNGTDCAACSEHCPTKAVTTTPYGNHLRLPLMKDELCIGCGACEYACPVKPEKAIRVTGLREHGLAKNLVQPKATLPKSAADFPF